MNPPIAKSESTQAQVERLTAEAKKFSDAGKEAQALEVYRSAASLMPGAPWLQHRTAELARKLKQTEVAAAHYRRAAAAFVQAGFAKRGIGPLRTGWTMCLSALPSHAAAFVAVASDLAELQRDLGFGAESVHLVESSNETLRAKGCRESVPTIVIVDENAAPARPALARAEPPAPPESGIKAAAAAKLFDRLRSGQKY